MNSRRSKLFNYLRVFFFCDLFLFLSVLAFWFWIRSDRARLLETVERQMAHNLALSSDLYYAIDYISNVYYRASFSFASNVLSRSSFSVSNILSRSSLSVSDGSNSFSSSVSRSSSDHDVEFPPLQFDHYSEVDNVPYASIGRKSFKVGDLLLGYPIQHISPRLVQYRGKFFPIIEDLK